MYIVVRTWSNGDSLADAMVARQQEVTGLLKGVPGFVAYYATRAGGTVTSVTVCESKEGTDESSRLAREWVSANLSGASIGTPQIAEGETFINF